MSTIIHNRYQLSHLLGKGGQGEVWAARDLELGSAVAVKRFYGEEGIRLGAFQAELGALELLKLPGVARLLGSGVDGASPFLVIRQESGVAFPGTRGAGDWAGLVTPLTRLLAVLSSVHAAGVVHGDLKPGNVLVDGEDAVTLVDFGLAGGRALRRALEGGETPIIGTQLFSAPEVLEGEAPSPRSDLFAVGVLVWTALTGRGPWGEGEGGLGRHLTAMRAAPAPSLRAAGVALPEEADHLIGRLLALAPANRPASATETLWMLNRLHSDGPPPCPDALLARRAGPPLSVQELASLFHGPSRLLHLPEGAAQVLVERTAGDPDAVVGELSHWGLAGLVSLEGDRYRIALEDLRNLRLGEQRRLGLSPAVPVPVALTARDHQLLGWVALAWPYTTSDWLSTLLGQPASRLARQLERLVELGQLEQDGLGRAVDRSGGAALATWSPLDRAAAHATLGASLEAGQPGRLRHLLAADRLEEACREAEHLARQAGQRGDLPTALSLLEGAISWALADGDPITAAHLLRVATPMALATEERGPLRRLRALFRDPRIAQPDPTMLALLEAGIQALGGDAIKAAAALDSLPGELPPQLALRRTVLEVRVAALGPIEAHEALLRQIDEAWAAEGSDHHARTHGWWGQLRYREARYSDAAALHLKAAAAKDNPTARISSLLNAATALLEADRWEEAAEVAGRAEGQAQELGLTKYEACALGILRSAAYRSDSATPDPTVIEAARLLEDRESGAILLLTEAAAAWRSGRLDMASEVALAARDCFEAVAFADGATLALALAEAARPSLAEAEVEALLLGIVERGLPLIQVQVLGLLGPRVQTSERWRRAAVACAQALPEDRWPLRREVLSVREALTAFGVESSIPESQDR